MVDPERQKTSKVTWAVLIVGLTAMPLLHLLDRYYPIGWMHDKSAPKVQRHVSTASVSPQATDQARPLVYCTDNQSKSVSTHQETDWHLVKPWFGQPYYESDAGTIFVIPAGLQCSIIKD